MVAALWIFGILAVLIILILLLCLTWVGIRVHLTREEQVVDVRIGWLQFRIYPARKKEKRAKKEQKKAMKASESGKTERKRSLPKFKLADLKDAVRTLWPPLKKALEQTRKGIRVDPLDLSVTLGGEKDPADAAKWYAYLHAGMWTGMPLLEKVIDIPDPHIHVGLSFRESNVILEGDTALKAHVGTLLRAAFGIGIPALRWFLQWKKQQTLTAVQPTVSERTESNGQ